MTTPKVLTLHNGGSRFYVHPETGEKVPGVTSVLNMLPKPFLKAWAAKLVAETAVQNIGLVASMAESDPAGAIDYLKRSPQRNTQAAADAGSAAHGIFEALALGRPVGKLTPDLEPWRRQFESFLATVQPEILESEETVWSDTHKYAGSFDAFMRIQGEGCWADYKTGRSGVYPEVALQLSAYKHADFILDGSTGVQRPVPDGARGVVLHVRPEGWALYEVPIGPEVFDYFLAVRQVFVWDGIARTVVGKPLLTGAAA